MAFILGYIYVQAFVGGWRAVVALHTGILFFMGCAFFIRDLKSFLIFLMIFAIPMELGYHLTYQHLTNIESSPFSIGLRIDIVDVALLLLYMHWGFMLAQEPLGRVRITFGNALGKLFLVWLAWVWLAGILRSDYLDYTLFELVTLLKGYLLYFYLVNNLSTERDLRLVLYAFFAITVVQGLYIILQYVTGLNYNLHGEGKKDLEEAVQIFRPVGFTGSWDESAAIMNYVLPAMLVYYYVVADKFKRGATLIGIGIVLLGLLLTKMRSAYLAALVSTTTVLAVSFLRGWISFRRMFPVVLPGLACVILALFLVFERFEAGQTGEERIPLMLTAFNMIKANWLLGVGSNNYFFHIGQYLPVNLRHTWQYIVHNEYLLRAAETGILGFFLYYSMLLMVMRKLWKAAGSTDPWIYTAGLGLFAALLGSIPYRILSFFHTPPLYSEFCVVLALTYLFETLEKRRLSAESAGLGLSRGNSFVSANTNARS